VEHAAAADEDDDDNDEEDDEVEVEGREDVVDGASFLSANSLAALELIGQRQEDAARAVRGQQDPGSPHKLLTSGKMLCFF